MLFFLICRHTTAATTTNPTKEIPVDDMQQENPSYDTIKSTCDDEEEHLVKVAEGFVINKINKLNTTHMKFDGVNQVHVYIGGEREKTEILEETNADADIDLFNQEMSEESTTPPDHVSNKRGDPKCAPSTEGTDSEIRSDGQEILSQNNPAKKSSHVISSAQNNQAEGISPVISSVDDDDQEQTPLGNNHFLFMRGLYLILIICRRIYLDKN